VLTLPASVTRCNICHKSLRASYSLTQHSGTLHSVIPHSVDSEQLQNQRLCKTCYKQTQAEQNALKAKLAIGQLLGREDVLILDTETNGTGSGTEVIEVSVINTKGDILLDTLVRPKIFAMNPWAQNVHGISLPMLKDAPSWPSILPKLAALADRRTILAWNAPFDANMLEQTSSSWNLNHPRWLFVCAMRLYAKKRNIKNRGLHKAVVDENLTYLFEHYDSHRALGDITFVLEVLRATLKI
jgi:DNA polymerase III alpha subunit (gram-positive type)